MYLNRISLFLLMLLFIANTSSGQIHGTGLMVAPTRLVFEGKVRSAELTLTNHGKEVGTYRVSTINYRMTETGEREPVSGNSTENDFFADKMIRFAPRQIRLKPGEQQTIRVMARTDSSLREGEYRTGLNFQWVPEPGKPRLKAEDSKSDGISVKLEFSFGITIPVIIRHGNLAATGKIARLQLEKTGDSENRLAIYLERHGNRSIYGDFEVAFLDGLKVEPLVAVKGVAVYVPNSKRIFKILLPAGKSWLQSKTGKLKVVYKEPMADGGATIAESLISLKQLFNTALQF